MKFISLHIEPAIYLIPLFGVFFCNFSNEDRIKVDIVIRKVACYSHSDFLFRLNDMLHSNGL